MENQLFHANGWTDMTELRVAFRNFATAPKKVKIVAQAGHSRLVRIATLEESFGIRQVQTRHKCKSLKL
jgi:hypothetical protein